MRNPHRVYEIDQYETGDLAWSRRPFLEQFVALVDHCLAGPRRTVDPRQRLNMQPEPYRPAEDIVDQPAALRKRALDLVTPNLAKWEWLYEHLEDQASKRLLLLVLSYRSLSWNYVRLPLDNELFWSTLSEIAHTAECAAPEFILKKGLQLFNLRNFERDIVVYTDPFGLFNEFLYSQYIYRGVKKLVMPDLGDYVLDCGACYGGTSLAFADMVGTAGRVYSFEFMPDNTAVYRHNIHENINVQNRISLIEIPVWSQSNLTMSITGGGPAAQVHFAEIDGSKKIQSIAIDDFVFDNGLPRLNFIKMDIEGAEIEALKGAMRTIEKFRPKLAIAAYHNLSDFYEIPRLLRGIHKDYEIHFGHSTVHGDESVIFAS
jgi:FkbM family methyltransferase